MPVTADETTRRLTLILSGAVSLGAYEGGVASQIAYALARWNEARPDQPPLAVIDVIAGASAGSMTGAMLAHHLAKGTDPKEFVNNVRESWCGESTLFRNMLQMKDEDRHAFFSTSRIDDIASTFFKDEAVKPERVRQEEVVFTCTLTALDAIPYQFKLLTRKGLADMHAWTRQDWITFSVTPDAQRPVVELPTGRKRSHAEARQATWDRLIHVAVASGAFPAAFQPMQVSRKNTDYPRPLKERGGWTRMRYTDGGVLDNMPFKRAADALSCMQRRSLAERRLHVLIEVEPYRFALKDGSQPDLEEEKRDQTPLAGVLSATFEAMRQQSLYSDLFESQEVNRRLSWRDRFLYPALAAAATAVGDLAAATAEARKDLAAFLGEKWSTEPRTVETELAHYQELAKMSGTRLAEAAASVPEDRRDLFLLQAALTDNVSGLRGKCPIRVERVSPANSSLLAGEGLGAFGGFLDQDLTRHDFLCGLRDGYAWLQRWADDEGWPAPASVDWHPREPRGTQLAAVGLGQFPSQLLEDSSDLAIRRTLALLAEELHVPQNLVNNLVQRGLAMFVDSKVKFWGVDDIPRPENPDKFNPAHPVDPA